MKWFLGLHEKAPHFSDYCDLVKVAIVTARRFTRLEPHLIYDGGPNAFTAWLERNGVGIIHRQSYLLPALRELGNETGLRHGPGVFLRMEIPDLVRELGWDDERVVYTDCDVFFTGDPLPVLEAARPEFFAIAPEHDRNNPAAANSGVMVMNLPGLRSVNEEFKAYTRSILDQCVRDAWDQYAYLRYFAGRWQVLPCEVNWKTYWGYNPAASIVHFHGPKPFLRERLGRGAGDPLHQPLVTDAFWRYLADWDKVLAEAG